MINRSSGVLLPISSLPSPYGIGTFGKEAYRFVDFLSAAGQSYWQILPLGITGYGDSPYQSPSVFAGNHYFIDLESLVEDGYLESAEVAHLDFHNTSKPVDYHEIFVTRIPLLRKAFNKHYENKKSSVLAFFNDEKDWLESFALFMAIKNHHNLISWQAWPEAYRSRDSKTLENFKLENQDELHFWYFVQYLFFQQWEKLKGYANSKNIKIIGDLPIYVAEDSVDVWANPELYLLDDQKKPTLVAGCPPDSFAPTGQLWGNSIYHWEFMKEEGYSWWIKRMAMSARIYDVIRIDHFRGFEAYYVIPNGNLTAERGEWVKGPGMDLFKAMEHALGKLEIIVEDLGFETPEFHAFKKSSGYPGMYIMQFSFDDRDQGNQLPFSYEENSVVYTGTHDNNTIIGWIETEVSKETFEYAQDYLLLTEEEGYSIGFIRGAWNTASMLAIAPMQDLLGIGASGRINKPSTMGNNWKWRMRPTDINDAISKKLLRLTKIYARLNTNSSFS